MRMLINLVLVAAAAALVWLLYGSIQEPIAFNNEKNQRKEVVIAKLEKIRTAQEFYRNIKGMFTSDFDSLAHVLTHDSFSFVKVIGDPDDPQFTGEITYDTTYLPARDTISKLGIDFDDIRIIPFNDNKKEFVMEADTIIYQQVKVPVLQVSAKWKDFMGKYADAKYSRYDQKYNPSGLLKFGSMSEPNLSGNWAK